MGHGFVTNYTSMGPLPSTMGTQNPTFLEGFYGGFTWFLGGQHIYFSMGCWGLMVYCGNQMYGNFE